jgi:GTPase Era involved in 16S rRNA processing
LSDIITVVEGLDFVVSLAEGHVHPEDLDSARSAASAARSRAGHLGSTMVLALVGGTGSGKSSLLNAFAGEQIASTSAVRPHTSEPLAWVPAAAEPSLRVLLDRLGVEERVSHHLFAELAILDMTDVDSIATEHRDRVERLMPEVDVVVWVLDPVKYSDPSLHRALIAPLAGSADRVIFVLNKVDSLDEESLDVVVDHLGRLLAEDGFSHPVIFEVAADPPDSEPRGIDALAAHLRARLDEKRVHVGKIIDDARRAARAVAGAAGVSGSGSLDFEERWLSVREAIVTDLVARGGPATFEEALRLLGLFILGLSTDAGGVFGQRIRQTFREELIEVELASAMRGAETSPTPGSKMDEGLQERFGVPLRKLLWERASLAAVVAGLTVDAMMVDESLGRTSR